MVEFETLAIHAGQEPDPATGAVNTPVYLTSTYAQQAVGDHKGYEYSRTGNPTRTALETCFAALEGAKHGWAFASGMSATDTILRLFRPGDHFVIPNDAYGGTYRLIDKVFAPAGFSYTPADLTSIEALEQAITPQTKLIWIESPTNPLLSVVDIERVVAVARDHNLLVAVDNTFATPYLQRPLELGADIVVHSTTKYAGGHSDLVGGFVALNDDELSSRIGFLQNSVGAVPSPMDCFLTLRGLKTLAVRLDRSCENATAIAEMLAKHPRVKKVLYPGLEDHETHEVAKKQMRAFGGMVSFIVKDGEQASVDICARTRVFTLAESLGAVESLIEHPARMTHASVAGSQLEVDPSLIRLSVGIENVSDLLDDLRQALG